jgi:hypothetical protein
MVKFIKRQGGERCELILGALALAVVVVATVATVADGRVGSRW